VGVALADALDAPAGDAPPRIGLKWPNDLWLMDGPSRGRKLGGVLIETVAVGDRRMAVIGVGLNVRPQPLTQDLGSGFACLQELWPDIDAPQALKRVAAPLARALTTFEREGLAPFVADYRRRDLLLGQPVSTTQAGVPEGIAEGIDEQGALRVRAGGVHTLVSGEVSVRPA
jgi:BirA family biotin operon repressor/biotin-[acetyl-CoA-carboxylase] ligase